MSIIARRLGRITPSPTNMLTGKLAEMKAAGTDVIGLGAGEPDFDTPENIKQAAVRALERGETRYTPIAGTAALREAISAKFKRENGLDYAADRITVCCGGDCACRARGLSGAPRAGRGARGRRSAAEARR